VGDADQVIERAERGDDLGGGGEEGEGGGRHGVEECRVQSNVE
jgi:hypothetical protein